MRAVILTSFSGLEALELADLPEPTPREGEEVVSVRAVALGPWDLSAADGYFQQLGGSTAFPQVQGWDFAGQTADGRRVLGFTAQPWMGVGALAEQIAMPAVLLAPLPGGLDWAQGAALPVTALTALPATSAPSSAIVSTFSGGCSTPTCARTCPPSSTSRTSMLGYTSTNIWARCRARPASRIPTA